jgi:hypothetical protein
MMSLGTFNLLGVLLSFGLSAAAQSDFDEYVASIRESGMSENAASSVRTVAGILAGSTVFRATRMPDGSVGHSYSGLPAGERDVRATGVNRESWTAFLRQQADTDHSGFVSTKEGFALRRLVEMGLVADQLKLRSVEELERALPANALETDLSAYAALRAEAVKQGLTGMPVLPGSLDATPR